MKGIYSTKEVAKILDIKPDQLQKQIWLEKFPAPVKLANRYLWSLKNIEAAAWALKRYDKLKAWQEQQSLPKLKPRATILVGNGDE